LLIFGFIRGPISNLPWFLGAQLIMASELVRDVVLSRRALRQAAELQSQLARVERLNTLGQLASSLVHELIQPLAANSLNASAALAKLKGETPDLEGLQAILSSIDTGSRRATDLIARMRKFARNREIELQPLTVEELVTDTVALIGADLQSKRAALTFDITPGLPKALGDRVHLSQVLLNLLMNAIQAVQSCPPGRRWIAVEAHEVPGKNRIEVTVRDSGQGVPNDVAEKIFLPFFTTKADGMGMGLALSHVIIDAHGGSLWVDRRNRDGAAFCFTLQQA
jgi:two-component system sensor kinase FixL